MTTDPPSDLQHGAQTRAPRDDVPRLAEGLELIGEYEGSGFKQPPYIVRRTDGQVVQMPKLLYLVVEAVDGERDYEAIGRHVSDQIGRGLDADGARLLVEEKLRPMGIAAQPDGSTPELEKLDPLLALRMKTSVVPPWAVNAITRVFRPLFWPPVVAGLLATFFALDVWLFAYHGVAQSLRQVLYDPLFILLLLLLVVVSAAFHECGHATACAYGGARPGAMGVGIYLVWPAFYTDVTDAYRLGKGGRLRTDLGGVYFNSIFTIATFGAYFLTGWEPLLLVVPLQIMEMMHQFLPFVRLDGYYIVSDLTGVPDMFARIKPTLKSLNPLDTTPPEVRALRPWVRAAVSLYVFTVVPLLLFLLGLTAVSAPRIVATGWSSLLAQNAKLHHHIGTSGYLHAAVDTIEMAVLVLPIAGLVAMFWKLGKTIVTGAWARTEGRRIARALLVCATAAATAIAAYAWLPSDRYRAIAAGDRGTLDGGIRDLSRFGHPRPEGRRPPAGGGMTTNEAPSTTATDTGTRTTSGTPAPSPTTTASAPTTSLTGSTAARPARTAPASTVRTTWTTTSGTTTSLSTTLPATTETTPVSPGTTTETTTPSTTTASTTTTTSVTTPTTTGP